MGIFYNCSSLVILPDISKWNTSNFIEMIGLFFSCSSLVSLPDISKWNIDKVTDISSLFSNCSSLSSLPDITKWNTNKNRKMKSLFSDCFSLLSLLDLSKWNNFNEDEPNQTINYNFLNKLKNIIARIKFDSLSEVDKYLNDKDYWWEKNIEVLKNFLFNNNLN